MRDCVEATRLECARDSRLVPRTLLTNARVIDVHFIQVRVAAVNATNQHQLVVHSLGSSVSSCRAITCRAVLTVRVTKERAIGVRPLPVNFFHSILPVTRVSLCPSSMNNATYRDPICTSHSCASPCPCRRTSRFHCCSVLPYHSLHEVWGLCQ